MKSISAKFVLLAVIALATGFAAAYAVGYYESFTRLLIILIIGFSLLCVGFIITARSIKAPMHRLTENMTSAAKGNFSNEFVTGSEDDFGRLEDAAAGFAAAVKKLTGDITAVAEKHEAGNTDVFVEENAYEGAFRELARRFNSMLRAYANDITELGNGAEQLAKGDFNQRLKALPGKKAAAGESIERLRVNIKHICDETQKLAASLSDGRLSQRAESGILTGEWARAISGMNTICDAVSKPVTEFSEMAKHLSDGNFSESTRGNYNGEFNNIKTALNLTAKRLQDISREIPAVLDSLSNNRSPRSVSAEYPGAFSAVKTALNNTLKTVSDLKAEKEKLETAAKQASLAAKPAFKTLPAPAARITPAARPATTAAASKADAFVSARPKLQKQLLTAPDAAHIYDSKDFGKY